MKYFVFLLLIFFVIACARYPIESYDDPTDSIEESPTVEQTPPPIIEEEPEIPESPDDDAEEDVATTPDPAPDLEKDEVAEVVVAEKTCSLGNACDGRPLLESYICNQDGAPNRDGWFICECTETCEIKTSINPDAYCSTGVQCLDKRKGFEWGCGPEGIIDGERRNRFLCSCDQNCDFSSVCNIGNTCDGRETGVTFRCDISAVAIPDGYLTCTCTENCQIFSVCDRGNACDQKYPGTGWRCDASGEFSETGNFFCECQPDCSINIE